jgi:hypothetical protein
MSRKIGEEGWSLFWFFVIGGVMVWFFGGDEGGVRWWGSILLLLIAVIQFNSLKKSDPMKMQALQKKIGITILILFGIVVLYISSQIQVMNVSISSIILTIVAMFLMFISVALLRGYSFESFLESQGSRIMILIFSIPLIIGLTMLCYVFLDTRHNRFEACKKVALESYIALYNRECDSYGQHPLSCMLPTHNKSILDRDYSNDLEECAENNKLVNYIFNPF